MAHDLVTKEEFEQIVVNEANDFMEDIKLLLVSKDLPTSADDIQTLLSLVGVGKGELTVRQIVLLAIIKEVYVLLRDRQSMSDFSEKDTIRLQELKKSYSKDLSITEAEADEIFNKEEIQVKMHRLQEIAYKDARFNTKTLVMQAMIDIIGLNEGELTKEKIILFLSTLKDSSLPSSMTEVISLGLLLGLTDIFSRD